MKIDDKTYVESTVKGGTAFGIEDSPKIFKVLSKNIYKNPIMAFIRELTTNAADAHIDANNTNRAIDIKLPTMLDHSFYVRDYGTGMSHENLLAIYKTYFKSTKSSDNMTDGMYGLGSKSPFAYSNDFTVDCYYNGMHYSYLAMFDESDRPQFVPIVVDEKTNEPNGIKVTVTVKQNDFARIYSEAVRVLIFVDAKINLMGDSKTLQTYESLKKQLKQPVYEDADVAIYNANVFNSLSNVSQYNALQGNVCYPIDFSTINSVLSVKQMFNSSYASNYRYFFKFNRGELNVPPSREEISYDKVYVDRVIKKSETAIDRVSAKLLSELSKLNELTEYIQFITDSQKRNELHFFAGLFYSDDARAKSSSKLNAPIEFKNPYDSSKIVTRPSVLSDLQNGNAAISIIGSCEITVPIGKAIMTRHMRDFMTSTGIKVDEYKDKEDNFVVDLYLKTMSMTIDESYCIAEKEHHKNANNGNLSKYAASTHSNGWKPKVFIEQDNIKNLTMIHFTKLMANNAMNDNVFFVESIDMKKILHNFKITLDLFTACGRNHELQQHMQKKFNYYKSSEAWTKFLATKSDAYRGLEISVAEFVPEYLAKYNNIEFKKSTVTTAEKCQEIIESGEYLIARTFAHEADCTVTIGGKDHKITNKDTISRLIASLWAIEHSSKLKDIKGVIFIKKTSYDKLVKKEIDMSKTLDAELSNMINTYSFVFDHCAMSETYNRKVDCFRKIAKILEDNKIVDTIASEIVSTADGISKKFHDMSAKCAVKMIGSSYSGRHNVEQHILTGFKQIAGLQDSSTSGKNVVLNKIAKFYNKYPIMGVVAESSLSNSAQIIVDYIVQCDEYAALKANASAKVV